jgi:hypothetical protein
MGEMGIHVGKTMCEKSLAEVAVVIWADKCQEMAVICHPI